VKILLDTDIGSDIDDAICLAYLLAQPECELVGITTVSGESDKRAWLADALCKVAGKEIPIFPGNELPLLVEQKQPHAPQVVADSNWPHSESFPKGRHLNFMRRVIRQHPQEIVLLAIGPLTNVALLLAADPEIAFLLKGLVLMCGIFVGRAPGAEGHREWNARCDPHAAAIVYKAPIQNHRSIGLDVTLQVTMSEPEVRRRFQQHALLRPVLDFSEPWFQHAPEITFHDPLAAATIFDSSICRFEPGNVEVELTSSKALGMTYWEPGVQGGKHNIAVDVNVDRFLDHYFSVFK